ncbi:MAG: autotransporter-associated beta strand repeat-containing protein [Verrucomicrobiota bacterium]|nr:autotransporter-associated beta strand repeat-containing protein [Verrucomicrobiota bacterium]
MNRLELILAKILAAAAVLCCGPLAHAANVVKADNTDDLDLASSWTNGVVPGAGDTAVWDSTVTGPNSTVLSNSLTWGGLQILNPGGAVTIGATATNANAGATLTFGAGGIDMSQASQSLTLNAPVSLLGQTVQSWNVGSGLSLSLGSTLTRSSAGELRFSLGSGATVNIAGGTANSALYYSLLNGTDVGALDASLNLAPAASVIHYVQNVAGGDAYDGTAGEYEDVVNGNPSGDDVDYGDVNSGVHWFGLVRFDAPEPYRNSWVYNAGKYVNEVNGSQTTYLMTTNVGSQDVIIEGNPHAFRWAGSHQELILDQEDPDGTFYVNGATSDKNHNNTLTKLGIGRVVWNANVANGGPIYVVQGDLMMNGNPESTSSVTVDNGGILSGTATIPAGGTVNGGTIQPGGTDGLGALTLGNLTLNSGSTLAFKSLNATLNLTGGLTVNGPVEVSVLVYIPAVGQYPLVKWTNGVPASAFTNFDLAVLPLRTEGYLSNNTANSSIDLVVTNLTEPIKWTTGNGTWDIATTTNWADAMSAATTYQEANGLGDSVLFDDTASGTSPIAITLDSTIVPAAVTFDNSTKDYTLNGTGDIAGLGALTMSGSGMLTLGNTNTFFGGLNLDGGTVNFSTLANLGAGAITFESGTLQYAPGNTADISVRTVTFDPLPIVGGGPVPGGIGGGTIDDGGNTLNFANPIGNGGAGGFTKTGAGTLTLNGPNNYSGPTTVSQGTLALGASASIPQSVAIHVNAGATLDTATGGVGLGLNGSVGQILAGAGTVTGEVTNGVNTTISPVALNHNYGTLTFQNDLSVEGGTLVMDISPTNSDLIAVGGGLNLAGGTVQVNVNGTLTNGTYKLITFGSLTSGAGSSGNLTLTGFSEPGHSAFLADTANEVDLVVAAGASDNLTWAGSGSTWDTSTADWLNGATAWIFTNGDSVSFNDSGSAQSSVQLQDAVQPALVTVDSTADYTFNDGTGIGGGKISGGALLVKSGSGTLTINSLDDNNGGVLINAGTVQVGGTIGNGNVTNNASLVFNQSSDQRPFKRVISGAGSLTQAGSATLTLDGNNTYTGPTLINSGAIQLGDGLSSSGNLGAGSVTNNSLLVLNHGSGSYSLANNVTGAGALAKIGPATVVFGGSLTYQGDTSISNGVVKLSANNQLPNANTAPGSTGALVLDGGTNAAGTLDLAGYNETINALTGASGTINGVITNSASKGTSTLTVLGNAATTYNGVIADAGKGKIQLVVLGANTLTLASADTYSGGTVVGSGASLAFRNGGALGTGPVTMSNNATLSIAYHGQYLSDAVTTIPGATATFGGNVADDGGWSGAFNGDSTATNIFNGRTTWHTSGQFNNFNGTVLLTGDPLANDIRVYAASDGGTNMTMDLEGGSFYVRDNGDVIYFGALTGSGLGIINGHAGIYIVGDKGIDTTYGGTFTGTSSLVKDGAGTLTLFGTNESIGLDAYGNPVTNASLLNETTFTGGLTVSNGLLAVQAPNNLNDTTAGNPSAFTLAGTNAVLDLSSMGSSPDGVTLATNSVLALGVNSAGTTQTLAGFGTIRGSVAASSGSTVAAGLPLGALTVTSSIELGGTLALNVNATNSPNSSEIISPTITVDSGATLVVTNLGPEAGTKFQLFSQAVNTNGVTIELPTLSGTNSWINDLAVDGSLTLVAPPSVNTAPTNIVTSISGGNLTLSWPTDHTGWTLQAQTNALDVGLGTNWVDVAGSSGTNQITLPLNPANGVVFFRLVYP